VIAAMAFSDYNRDCSTIELFIYLADTIPYTTLDAESMPPIRFTCSICSKMFPSSLGLLRHKIGSKDHQGVGLVNQRLPSYTDPDFERTDTRNHHPEWDQRPEELVEFGGGDEDSLLEENELDDREPDQIFEGAGIPLKSIILSFQGEPNENGPRIPEPREEARALFQQARGEFKNGRYQHQWAPYNSRQQFRLSRRNVFPIIPSRRSILSNCVGKTSDRLHPTELKRRFTSVDEFFSHLNTIAKAFVTPWKSAEQTSLPKYTIYHRNSLQVMQELVGDKAIGPYMKWAPLRRFDQDGNRVYSEIYTANWMWEQQEILHPDQEVPEDGSKTIIPIFLSSDKTVYGSLSGEAYGWPLYMSIGNIPSEQRWKPTRPHWRAIGLLSDPQGSFPLTSRTDGRCNQGQTRFTRTCAAISQPTQIHITTYFRRNERRRQLALRRRQTSVVFSQIGSIHG
jgi:hypothetical protein